MKILIDIGHPADVHQFKNMIWKLEKKRHSIKIIARDKECTLELLNAYNFKYIKRPGYRGFINKIIGIFVIDLFIYKIAKKFKPDILIGSTGNLYIAQVAWLLRKPSYIFDDTEHAKFQLMLMRPFATKIFTPSCYEINLGKKQIKYNGFKELAYLHPDYFKANEKILDQLNLKKDDKYFVIRFVSWEASHDINCSGIKNKMGVVKELEKLGKVFIVSEKELPSELQEYEINIKPQHFHSLIYYSSGCISEGASVATEAALLGIPTIYSNTLSTGYIRELEKHGVLVQVSNDNLLVKIKQLLVKNGVRNIKKRLSKLIKEKEDVTDWMVNKIEESAK